MNYTMNYEKLYKSVLVKIQEALASTKDGHKISGLTRDCLENIFPELKENENERIRKVLIDYFQAYKEKKERGITTFNGIPTDNILAWLEKQSEQKPQGKTALEAVKEEKIDNQNCVNPADKVEPKFHPGDTMRTLQEASDGYTDGMPVVVSIDNEYYHCTNELIAIKDQDNYEFPPINVKQKPSDEVEPKFHEGDIVQYITDSTDRRKIEEIDTFCNMYHTDSSPIMFEVENEWKVVVNAEDVEQESTNNVEPKFKVRDWVVKKDGEPFAKGNNYAQITNIDKEQYWFDSGTWLIAEDIRLWSIDDAKRGDVLVDAYGNIGIFDKCYDLDWMSCCSLVNNGCFQYFTVKHKNEKTYPATKEQRELLFQKMKDARWEWDSVNKDLKRITKFKIGDKVHCGDETQPVTIIGITNDSYTTDSMIGPIPFSEEDNWTLIKHKFNVDDWIVFNGLILHIDEVVNGYYVTTSIGDDIHNSYDWDIDNVARLWNISDAKCGDVLISSPHKQPFVYNGNHTRDDIGAYFGLNYQGELLICDSHGNNWTELTGVQPATEEQCNALFKKLHDSDYKWNSKKKELWHKYL